MLRTIILSLSLICLAPVAQGQANVRKAKKILNQVSKHYKGLKTLKATFDLTITDPNAKKPVKKEGTLFLKGKKYRIETDETDIICDSKTRWIHFKKSKEVQIDNYRPEDEEISPNNMFTIYESGFKYLWVESKTFNGKTADVIELVPKTDVEMKEYTKIKLYVNAKQIIGYEIFMRGGSKTLCTVKTQVDNLEIPDKTFTYTKIAGVKEIDLR
ncbi:MAG: outer membrane lipoprotein carrier protein LolA [Bacteroidetes bacterium]|nr:MAG: outer membrane lipoprotein carrier protein LolA [Bacteroidota bacterium]